MGSLDEFRKRCYMHFKRALPSSSSWRGFDTSVTVLDSVACYIFSFLFLIHGNYSCHTVGLEILYFLQM